VTAVQEARACSEPQRCVVHFADW